MMKRREFLQSTGSTAAAWAAASVFSHASPPQNPLIQPSFPDPKSGVKTTGGWSLAIIPDTQNYVKVRANQPIFHRMTRWLKEHAEAWNIQAVLHEGDIVNDNDMGQAAPRGRSDQNSESQWECARKAMETLHGVVPTIYTTGNHDYGSRNAENRQTQFNSYFGLTDNPLTCDGNGGGIWRESGANSYGAKTLENAAYEIVAPDGRKLLILSLEWGPRREAVDWGKQVLKQAKYKDHFGIFLVHDYLTPNGSRDSNDESSMNPHHYATGKNGNTHDGEDLWQILVKPSPQIQMTLNGHQVGRHVAYRNDLADHGKNVHQMLFNAQGLGKGNGGDGWIRLLTFEPDGKSISARTFSPFLLDQNQDPWNRAPEWSFTIPLS